MGIKTYLKLLLSNRLFLLVLLLGAAFRLSGIFWGVVIIDKNVYHYHPDEPKIIEGAYEFPQHILANEDLRYPTAFHYGLGLISLPLKLLPFPEDYVSIYMLGRIFSFLAGTLTIILVALLANLLFDERHSLMAGFLIAFSIFHVTNSAWATTDVMTAFWLTVTILSMLLNRPIDDYKKAIWIAIPLGLTVGTKYTGVVVVIPALILWFTDLLKLDKKVNWWKTARQLLGDRYLWSMIAVALGVFLLTTPGIWLKPQAFIASFESEQLRLTKSSTPLYDPEVYLGQFLSLVRSQGWLLAIASLLGILLNLIKPKIERMALIMMLLVYSLALGDSMLTRYWILLIPVLVIFASDLLMRLWSVQRRWLQQAGRLLVVAVCIQVFLYSLGAILARYPDTRTQAADYIMANIPPGTSIGIGYTSPTYTWKAHRWRYPAVDFERYQYKDFLEQPEVIVLSSYDFVSIRETLQLDLLDNDYNLPEKYKDDWYRSSPPTAEIFKLHEGLWLNKDSKYCLLTTIKPTHIYVEIEFASPEIEIYSRNMDLCEGTSQ